MRLLDGLYFGAGLHRIRVRKRLRWLTRRERLRALYGPSRVECLVVLVWLLVVVLVLSLFVRLTPVLDGPVVR